MSGNGPSRRDFLTYGGAAIAGITLGETGRRWLARIDERAAGWRDRGVETWATSVCKECPSGCGLRVRLVDDVPVKIEGNPLCPIARGRLCAKGQATIESYFDPDRLVGPAHRIARGGPPRWEPLAWKDAVALAADRLKRAAGTPDGIVAIAAAERGPEAEAWTRFWRAAGARVAWTPLATADRLRPRLRHLIGADADPIFHVEHASYVLSFGAPLAEDWLSGVWAQRSFGRLRRGSGSSRGRLVHIDSRRSPTARKADEWLAVPPDKQTALAYGIASALFRENRIDRDRLAPIAGNLAGFEHQLVTYYTPDNVAIETGVPVVAILRLARELVATPRPLVIVDANAGAGLADAVFSLNVLIGAIDRAGGLFGKVDDPVPEREDATVVLRAIAEGRLKPSVLVFADSSALRVLGGPNHPEMLAERVPFVISCSPYVDEAAAIADVILPTDLPLESWQAMVPAAALGIDVVPAARPAVARRLDTRDKGALLRSLGVALGGAAEQACDWQSSEELVRKELKRLAGLRRGTPYVTTYETEWMQQLESGGWWASAADSDAAFAERVLGAGGWVDPFFDANQLTDALRAGRGLTFPLPEVLAPAQSAVRATGAAAPVGAAPSADSVFPISLVAFQPSVVTMIGNPNQPSLFELLGQPESVPWSIWVELGSEEAVRLGIPDRARVRLTSAHATIEAFAVHVDGLPAGMAALSVVPGAQTSGRWARLIGKDARRLWGNESPTGACAVRIART
jgi:anaerobic selenocysteine-containing dehydrogenase